MSRGFNTRAQFLDQRCSRSLIFDEHDICMMKFRQLADRTLEVWKIQFARKDIEQMHALIF
jgi:hypothetical protein